MAIKVHIHTIETLTISGNGQGDLSIIQHTPGGFKVELSREEGEETVRTILHHAATIKDAVTARDALIARLFHLWETTNGEAYAAALQSRHQI